MAKEEAGTPSKSEKPSSPAQEQSNTHPYPNWAAVQAYYGSAVASGHPGVNVAPPYFNSPAASGHPPHPYMWGTPPHMMSPYGAPYPAMFTPGGVYAHPSFMGTSPQGHANSSSLVASEAMAPTPLSVATPAKSSSSKDQSLVKRLKGLNGNAVSVSKENSGSSAASHSEDCGTEGSSHGNDEKKMGKGDHTHRKQNGGGTPSAGKNVHAVTVYGGESSVTSKIVPRVTMVPASVVGKPVRIVSSPTAMAASLVASSAPVPEVHSQDDSAIIPLTKDERELKRERRKQSNRESARRSRLRKQAEAEELAEEVESLTAENVTLRSEIDQFKEDSEKLRLENAVLMEQLKNIQQEGAVELVSMSTESPQRQQPVTTENFLSRVENSLSNNTHRETETNDQSNSGTKLHQLLESSSRADTVAAS